MQSSFSCPVCEHSSWERIHEYRYDKGDGDRLDAYVSLRRRILFEIWFPAQSEVSLTSVLCRSCGFMTYAPRPSGSDIHAKYRFLQSMERNIGGSKKGRDSRIDRHRAERIFRTVELHLSASSWRVLDVGGGDGKLMAPFLKAGHRCELVDYNVEPLKGVTKIGDTLDDVPEAPQYDIAICSHVLEHLAEPAEMVSSIAKRLVEGGLIYGEVPMGVWKGIGIGRDPVTHINFFTRSSFERLFWQQGLYVHQAAHLVGAYNRRMDVISVVATRRGSERQPDFSDGPEETRRLLHPSLAMELGRRLRLRRFPPVASIAKHIVPSISRKKRGGLE